MKNFNLNIKQLIDTYRDIVKEPDNPLFKHCKRYSDEFNDSICNALKDLLIIHKDELINRLNEAINDFDGNGKVFKISINLDDIDLHPIYDEDNKYYVNNIIDCPIIKLRIDELDPDGDRFNCTYRFYSGIGFLKELYTIIESYFSEVVGINVSVRDNGSRGGLLMSSIIFSVSDICKMYNIKEE